MFLATSHPHIDEDGSVWNIGTAHHKKSGFVYTIFKFEPKSEEQGKDLNQGKYVKQGKNFETRPER